MSRGAETSSNTASARGAAREAIRRGWSPIPVPSGAKGPRVPAWTKLRIDVEDVERRFPNDSNIGVLLGRASGGLVDVDLDCEEAVALAPEFLPETGLWSGRTSRLRSHAWYRVAGQIETARHRDGSTTLVETRSDGAQTLIPPSTHPSGDAYVWEHEGAEPGSVDAPELDQAVRHLALACLTARYWPKTSGSRHDTANALAGYLSRNGVSTETVATIVGSGARLAGDGEHRERRKTARSTVARIRGGRQATGGPTLRRLMGDDFVDRCASILGCRADSGEAETLSAFMSFNAYPGSQHTGWPRPLGQIAYRGIAGRFLELLAPHTEADPAAIMFQFLAAVGSRIGRHPYFQVESDRHFLNLYVALVGKSSKGRKGTSWSRTRETVGRGEEDWLKDHIVNGLSSGEGLIWSVRDQISRMEPIKNKGRVEEYQEVVVDSGVSDKRLLVVESELASTLKVMAREGNTLSPVIRSAWDDGQLRILTKNAPARATDAYVSIIGHITKDELIRSLNSTEMANGFANRFLWVCVKRARLLPDGGSLDPVNLAPIAAAIDSAVARAQSMGRLTRTPECSELWHSTYPHLSRERVGLSGSIVSRAEAQATRLSTLLAVLDECNAVEVHHLQAALELWRYCEESAAFIFGDQTGDTAADRILDELRRQPDGLTRTEIRDLFGRNASSARVTRALGILEAAGLAQGRREPTDGRPIERWYASPPYAINDIDAKSPPPDLSSGYAINDINAISASGESQQPSDDNSLEQSSDPEWVERRL